MSLMRTSARAPTPLRSQTAARATRKRVGFTATPVGRHPAARPPAIQILAIWPVAVGNGASRFRVHGALEWQTRCYRGRLELGGGAEFDGWYRRRGPRQQRGSGRRPDDIAPCGRRPGVRGAGRGRYAGSPDVDGHRCRRRSMPCWRLQEMPRCERAGRSGGAAPWPGHSCKALAALAERPCLRAGGDGSGAGTSCSP